MGEISKELKPPTRKKENTSEKKSPNHIKPDQENYIH